MTHEYLALVLLGRWVNVGDHGCSVGHEDGVHKTPGHHADHDDPHFDIIWRTRHRHNSLLIAKMFFFPREILWYILWQIKKMSNSYLLVRPWTHRREQSSGRELGKLPKSTSRSRWHSGRHFCIIGGTFGTNLHMYLKLQHMVAKWLNYRYHYCTL